MEPKSSGELRTPSLELPQSPETERQPEQTAEVPPAQSEQAGRRPKQPALPSLPDDIPAADQPVLAAPLSDVTAPHPTDPHTLAADADHIEHEWVDKVKNVVARTHDDPYLQKDQMSKVKAEYIQKRFNKTIKTDEAAA